MIAVIMQPTYLPWSGYFDLIDQSDVFIFLDTVQFDTRSWQQRNRIKTGQGAKWLTVPVSHSGLQAILDIHIDAQSDWRRKHWMSLINNYRKAGCWEYCSAVMEEAFERDWQRLADLNIHLTRIMASRMGIQTKFVRASELAATCGHKAEPLISLCKQVGADVYLSPNGSRTYLDDDKIFCQAGIELRFQSYEHPEYSQLYGEFLPFMSAIDLMANEGADSLAIMRSGRRFWTTLHHEELSNRLLTSMI